MFLQYCMPTPGIFKGAQFEFNEACKGRGTHV